MSKFIYIRPKSYRSSLIYKQLLDYSARRTQDSLGRSDSSELTFAYTTLFPARHQEKM